LESTWAVSADGEWAARGGLQGRIELWPLHGSPLDLQGPDAEVLWLEFSPENRQLAAAVGKEVVLFDRESRSILWTFEPHADWARRPAFGPDGRGLATASDDATIKVMDIATGRTLHTLRGHDGGVKAVRFSPDGRRIASRGADHTLRLWDPATGVEVFTLI